MNLRGANPLPKNNLYIITCDHFFNFSKSQIRGWGVATTPTPPTLAPLDI